MVQVIHYNHAVLLSCFQGEASTPARTLYYVFSVLLHVLMLTRCTHDCSLFIVHCSSFIVHCSLFIVHCSYLYIGVGKYYRYVTNPILARH
ncbi:hypothetical protein M6B38_250530 [Iris pallida]|uniref:Uncharacterized protein n=1 Tax=Iris pallida TaxID=29817 RepID=A0AAX6IK52_IRIPA|nr:hypothetical protein M6B38_355675 [Iris pallida]KAJ6853353.1 hypothetical protein M6B38_250525 [Iris pallida]KAJ6853354.1 hypothetical protein M6B38_250530 [Iris pallida]